MLESIRERKVKKERNLHTPTIRFKYNTKIISKSSDARIYKDVILLTAGEYTDGFSHSATVYSESYLKESANKWEANYLNLDHSDEVLKRLGFINNAYFSNGALKGDLYIFPITQAAKDVIGQIDVGLVNWLSVELLSNDYWDSTVNKRFAKDISFIGAAIVTNPACDNTRIIKDGPAPGIR